MPERAKAIGDRLRRTRLALGIERPIDFAREISVDKGTYSKFEAGERAVTLRVGIKIKDRWNIPLDWTFCGDPAQLPSGLFQKIMKIREAA